VIVPALTRSARTVAFAVPLPAPSCADATATEPQVRAAIVIATAAILFFDDIHFLSLVLLVLTPRHRLDVINRVMLGILATEPE